MFVWGRIRDISVAGAFSCRSHIEVSVAVTGSAFVCRVARREERSDERYRKAEGCSEQEEERSAGRSGEEEGSAGRSGEEGSAGRSAEEEGPESRSGEEGSAGPSAEEGSPVHAKTAVLLRAVAADGRGDQRRQQRPACVSRPDQAEWSVGGQLDAH